MEDFSEKSTRPLERYIKIQTLGLVYSESSNIGIRQYHNIIKQNMEYFSEKSRVIKEKVLSEVV